jgi:hypothetical protein
MNKLFTGSRNFFLLVVLVLVVPVVWGYSAEDNYGQWMGWTGSYNRWLSEQRYCMRWCNATAYPEVIPMTPEALFPDLTAADAIRAANIRNYSEPLQISGERALGLTCCHVCTSDCFSEILNSLPQTTVDPKGLDVTLVTTATVKRMAAFLRLRRLWTGPLAVIFYVTDYGDKTRALKETKSITNVVKGMENTLVLLYVARYERDYKTIITGEYGNTLRYRGENVPLLPINTLRNAITDRVKHSRFLFPADVDFLPSDRLYEDVLQLLPWMSEQDRSAVVFPHWEVRMCAIRAKIIKSVLDYPHEFGQFDRAVKQGLMRPFHTDMQMFNFDNETLFEIKEKEGGCVISDSKRVYGNKWGVRMTNYEKWIVESRAVERSRIRPTKAEDRIIEIPKSPKDLTDWEPFFVTNRFNSYGMLLRYNELFVARILNKVQWVASLRAQGYQFYTMRSHFLIHKNHAATTFVWLLQKQIPNHRKSLNIALAKELEEINKLYGDESINWNETDVEKPQDLDEDAGEEAGSVDLPDDVSEQTGNPLTDVPPVEEPSIDESRKAERPTVNMSRFLIPSPTKPPEDSFAYLWFPFLISLTVFAFWLAFRYWTFLDRLYRGFGKATKRIMRSSSKLK